MIGSRRDERRLAARYEHLNALAPALIEAAIGAAPRALDEGHYAVTSPEGTELVITLGRTGTATEVRLVTTPALLDGGSLVALLVVAGLVMVTLLAIGESATPSGAALPLLALVVGLTVSVRRGLRRHDEGCRARDVLARRLLRRFEETARDMSP